MGQARLWSVLGWMSMICWQLGAPARYGCLFEKRLCSRGQLCLDDALFGQCQDPTQQRVQYQVSVPVLQKLQDVLKQLMMQGLSWQDDIVQYVISKELSRVPQTHVPARPRDVPPSQPSQPWDKPSSKSRAEVDRLSPAVAQRYLDYMVLSDQPQASLHMQAPVVDPYTYGKYGYQEEERSLNSLDEGGYPGSSSRSGAGVSRPADRDRQLLQNLLSLYLSPSQPSSRHEVATAVSASPFYGDLDFPLDYTEDLIVQEEQLSSERQHKKAPQHYSAISGLDDVTLNRMASVLKRHGIDVKSLSLQQLDALAAALRARPSDGLEDPDRLQGVEVSEKKLTEGSMTHKAEGAPIPAPSIASLSLALQPLGQSVDAGAGVALPRQGGVMGGGAMEPKASELIGDELPKAEDSKDASPALVTGVGAPVREEYGYIVTSQRPLSLFDGVQLLETLANKIKIPVSTFINISVVGPALMFRLRQNQQNMSASDVADRAVAEKTFLESQTGLKILQTGVGERSDGRGLPQATRVQDSSRLVMLTLVGVACVGGILVVSLTIACLRHHARQLAAGKLGLGPEGGSDTHFEYQDLCRQHMAGKSSSGRQDTGTAAGGGGTDTSRVSSVSSQFSDAPQPSPSSHSSTPSWCEEPAQSNMDISTGHMILAYMEDHLKNKDRLLREWEALCSYQAEPSSVSVAQSDVNHKKNRNPEFVPYDHSRVKLKAEVNPSRGDYINASTIIEHDPRMPAYIATQGPLSHTISDFWQMVWESGCTVIVMMTALVEDGEKQCDRYWPDEGSSLYHIYEVNLVSEHIWCNDFLVRSFYLKNVQTQETRTLTQFHFLSWPAQGIPTSTRPLLDFRRKVNKCYRGRSCPIIVHCSDGTGRTGTYILIDMVLNRMAKGVKEIDIAATLEHIRDQRPGMVRTKDQFEFALTAVAEEVNAILKALPQ
ncbi:receptor-type tyrosine-protein phosphatase-like N [Scleropages formosus]|uniref:Protein tyrosine phosphatase receptor type N n=1 Tax=Scleropages formosus TaxID=113540 RepID=A0A8C9QZ01_SCLFO|nr:receptor-type tyrosine-protein phosphatase-like N [Scleropages formosus]